MSLRILSAFCTLGSLVELNCAVGQFEGTGGGLDCAAAVDVWATEDAAKRRTETTRAALYMFECILPALPVCKHRVQLAVNDDHALQIAEMECYPKSPLSESFWAVPKHDLLPCPGRGPFSLDHQTGRSAMLFSKILVDIPAQ